MCPIEKIHLDTEEGGEWIDPGQCMENELDTMNPPEQYLWRSRFIQYPSIDTVSDIVLSVHHIISDGLSVCCLMEELVAVAADFLSGRTPDRSTLPLFPPVDELLDPATNWEEWKSREEKEQAGQAPHTTLKHEEEAPIEQRRSKCVFRSLEPKHLENLRDTCHQKGLSVHAAVSAALLLAIQQHEGMEIDAMLGTAVDLRKRCNPPIPRNSLSHCALGLITLHSGISASADPWALARSYQDALHDRLRAGHFLPANFPSSAVEHLITEYAGGSDAYQVLCFISDLGEIDFLKGHRPLAMEQFRATASVTNLDFPIFVFVYTWKKRLNLSFTYTEPLVDPEWVRSVAEQLLGPDPAVSGVTLGLSFPA